MKPWKRIAKPVTDAAMFLIFLLVMGEAKLPGAVHEWLGIALFALFLFHTVLNIRWYRALFRGHYPSGRIVQTEEYDFSGKTVIPFFTHNGSSSGAGSLGTVEKLLPTANVRRADALSVAGNSVAGAESRVDSWLSGLGYQK